ncbi:MAG: Processing protease [Candidatus Gottesmanbacteria bacterium GW2011_GWB1_43_11]|uniref:Processing protease n=1 Tax=Candidatus Gottesmanbacteria bacterium GW2011_GWB1_43_11 TaxID=1618446 RepID=A0A0G1FEI8_9BACT|nr:MAG: Processing protease [Candidatus Gottesmanbacteria bacterium GW2011_GWA1_42_26]KKS85263.1 MAG: Processing protease [Candidatus Gottesmanbacteria bacterium GW2011_GWB1_43_11]OGG08809.1 MAG: hypothetical protein A2699_05845 [Candidatus Gottesmanbacteria bacterium RIFCSPHIGHO2_01_FULL_43_15]HCM38222.1 hypothetical protein [Patescibacteria group bacterium]
MYSFHRHTLKNKLELLTIPMPQVESATVMVMVGAGSRYESKKINGLAHFLEHMAFKGSKKRPSSLLISSTIDAIGGEFNAFTGKDHTGFYVKARSEHIPLVVDVLSDMILNPLLKEEEIEREKGVIIEEIHMYEDTPMRHIGDVYEGLLYGDTPLGWDTAGKPEIIRAIARKDFVTYMDGLYRPNNAVMVIAGQVGSSQSAVRSLIDKSLQGWKKDKLWQWKKQSDKQDQPQVKVKYKNTEQAHLALGVRAYNLSDPRRFALSVLTTIMGGGMSSRLFIEVRERRGLAYYVHANAEQYLDVGNFVTQAGVDVARIDEAIRVILDQYWGIANGNYLISSEELTKAKEYLKGRLTLELEDSRSVAGFYATQEILKRQILTPDEVIAKTEAVTKDEVVAVAREIFVEKHLNLAVIGPYKEEVRFRKLLESV